MGGARAERWVDSFPARLAQPSSSSVSQTTHSLQSQKYYHKGAFVSRHRGCAVRRDAQTHTTSLDLHESTRVPATARSHQSTPPPPTHTHTHTHTHTVLPHYAQYVDEDSIKDREKDVRARPVNGATGASTTSLATLRISALSAVILPCLLRVLALPRPSLPAGADGAFDKSLLPEIMQVKNFGRRGRTKWTHLTKEDTSQFDDYHRGAAATDVARRLERARAGVHADPLERREAAARR